MSLLLLLGAISRSFLSMDSMNSWIHSGFCTSDNRSLFHRYHLPSKEQLSLHRRSTWRLLSTHHSTNWIGHVCKLASLSIAIALQHPFLVPSHASGSLIVSTRLILRVNRIGPLFRPGPAIFSSPAIP